MRRLKRRGTYMQHPCGPHGGSIHPLTHPPARPLLLLSYILCHHIPVWDPQRELPTRLDDDTFALICKSLSRNTHTHEQRQHNDNQQRYAVLLRLYNPLGLFFICMCLRKCRHLEICGKYEEIVKFGFLSTIKRRPNCLCPLF
jgi:hypothetical protein